MRKTASKSNNTRNEILRVAETLFADKGYAATTTREIADGAGVRKAVLYYYFSSKAHLYETITENLFDELRGELNDLVSDHMALEDSLRRFLDALFGYMSRHPTFPRLFHRELLEQSPVIVKVTLRYIKPFFDKVVHSLNEGIRTGQLRNVNARQFVLSWYYFLLSYFSDHGMARFLLEDDPRSARIAEECKEFLVDYVVTNLRLVPEPLQTNSNHPAERESSRRRNHSSETLNLSAAMTDEQCISSSEKRGGP